MADQKMRLTHLILDLDETMYPSDNGVLNRVSQRMRRYLAEVIGIPPSETQAYRDRLFHTYGTTLRGLQMEQDVDTLDFLDFVHDIDLEDLLAPNLALRDMLRQYPQQKWVFTNASREHATRVLSCLGLEGLFNGIIDITDVQPWCKPHPEAFQIALHLCGDPNPEQCLFVDDNLKNVDTAASLHLQTTLISDQPNMAHLTISRLEQLADLWEGSW